MRRLWRTPPFLLRILSRVAEHDLFNLAQSTAYSAMVALFPALIVIAAAIGRLPDTTPLRFQLSEFFDRVLPSDVSPVLQSYFVSSPHSSRSARVLLAALLVSVTGASSVIAKIMEGLRRANDLPRNCWSVWRRRFRAYLLVPLSLLPFVITSLLVVFGHIIVLWLAMDVIPSKRVAVYLFALVIRWIVALTGSVGLLALLYHLGTPLQHSWKRVLPGAIAATAIWFVSTLIFGWYVTRFANYSQVYGSLGAGIALLFWLFITALSILIGAEFNAQLTAPNPSHELLSDPSDPVLLPVYATEPVITQAAPHDESLSKLQQLHPSNPPKTAQTRRLDFRSNGNFLNALELPSDRMLGGITAFSSLRKKIVSPHEQH